MAQSGYTPIILFNSGVTGHVPTTGNLTLGELAINYTDGIIFYNNGGTIKQFTPLALAATSGSINNVSVGATTPSTGAFTTLSATGLITPSTTIGIKGTTAADNAQAGSIGEYLTASAGSVTVATGGGVVNITSLLLTAGDWDVYGTAGVGSTALTSYTVGLALSAISIGGIGSIAAGTTPANNQLQYATIPPQRFNVSVSTTVYLNASLLGGAGVATNTAQITARRRR